MIIRDFFRFALIIVLITSFSSPFISCSDDDSTNSEGPEQKVSVPEKIEINYNGYISIYTFSYDQNLRIIEMNFSENDQSFSYKMDYDIQGRISKIVSIYDVDKDSTLYSYNYSSGEEATFTIDQGSGYISIDKFTFDKQKNVVNCVNTDSAWKGNINYEYNTDRDLTGRSYTNNTELYLTNITFKKDMPGIFSNVNISRLMAISLNEINSDFNFLFTWNKSFATITDVNHNDIKTYTYIKTNNEGCPETYKIEENKKTFTVKYIELAK